MCMALTEVDLDLRLVRNLAVLVIYAARSLQNERFREEDDTKIAPIHPSLDDRCASRRPLGLFDESRYEDSRTDYRI